MPAVVSTAYLSDEDLGAIIAYIKTVPPVDHKTSGQQFTPLAKIMLVAGVLPSFPVEVVSHDVHVTAPARGVKVLVAEDMPLVRVDRPRMVEVMQNLVDNAVKM